MESDFAFENLKNFVIRKLMKHKVRKISSTPVVIVTPDILGNQKHFVLMLHRLILKPQSFSFPLQSISAQWSEPFGGAMPCEIGLIGLLTLQISRHLGTTIGNQWKGGGGGGGRYRMTS